MDSQELPMGPIYNPRLRNFPQQWGTFVWNACLYRSGCLTPWHHLFPTQFFSAKVWRNLETAGFYSALLWKPLYANLLGNPFLLVQN